MATIAMLLFQILDEKKQDAVPHLLRDGVFWSTGVDVSLGPSITESEALVHWSGSNNANNKVIPFRMVDHGFVYAVGMKIGIVVSSNTGADEEDALLDGDHLEDGIHLRDIYGELNNVMIYTGVITRVGNGYFEHDINTFLGCSGAIVFLLDMGQPAFVSSEDYKKAIGVHVGYKPELRTNIAFKLTVLKRSKWVDLLSF